MAANVRFTQTVTTRAANLIALALLGFSAFLVPGLFPPPAPDYDLLELAQTAAQYDAKGREPAASAVRQYYEGFVAERRSMWIESVLFFCASVFAVLITFWRKNLGACLVLLVCAYLLYASGPAFVRMAIEGGLFNFMSIVFSTSIRSHGLPSGLLISWSIVVAPIAYALLGLSATYLLWQEYGRRKSESN